MLKLNLGCSDDLRPGFLNVDTATPEAMMQRGLLIGPVQYRQVDLTGQMTTASGTIATYLPQPWPWADSSVDHIMAHDVFEHIDNLRWRGSNGAIWCMNEAHRVLKPGGTLDLIVPCLDEDGKGVAPHCDPSHVQIWIGDWRYYYDEYFNHPLGERGRLGAGMGVTALFRSVGGESVRRMKKPNDKWVPIQYAPADPNRHKLMLILEAVK